MGRSYRIECKHCGTQFLQSTESNFGMMPTCIGCGAEENQMLGAIRCPSCQKRVNTTAEEFLQQVIEELVWE